MTAAAEIIGFAIMGLFALAVFFYSMWVHWKVPYLMDEIAALRADLKRQKYAAADDWRHARLLVRKIVDAMKRVDKSVKDEAARSKNAERIAGAIGQRVQKHSEEIERLKRSKANARQPKKPGGKK